MTPIYRPDGRPAIASRRTRRLRGAAVAFGILAVIALIALYLPT